MAMKKRKMNNLKVNARVGSTVKVDIKILPDVRKKSVKSDPGCTRHENHQ